MKKKKKKKNLCCKNNKKNNISLLISMCCCVLIINCSTAIFYCANISLLCGVEMIRAAGDMGATMIRDLAVAIIHDGKVPSDWEQSFIVCLYKGKGVALERGNYRGLKLTEQVMKIRDRIVDDLIRQSTVPSLASSQAEALQTQSF